ncbi:unnamed protein product [Adineta ricciae]|uniref:Uncharacterized protein n=1 Tax=Adineta ricciae TaxID=249248 RepID=A0A813SF28_ADIRI|nr:unnamed protein product [Adineta ricciae]CAF0808416.1 unnamed protein product [Adineta ricciae]
MKRTGSSKRNVENIRRKNVEDNQTFLKNLLMTDARSDFLNSARSALRRRGNDQTKKQVKPEGQEKEYSTRYSDKVKSGEIGAFVPEWQRQLEEKKKETEKRLLRKQDELLDRELRKIEQEILKEERIKLIRAQMPPPQPSRWVLYYKDSSNGNPYERVFTPRVTKVRRQVE